MSLPAWVVAALLVGLSAGFAGGWKVQAWRWAAADAARVEAEAEANRLQAKAADAAAIRHEATRERVRVQRQVVIQEVERLVYAENASSVRCLSDDGLRIVAAAARGTDTAGQPAPAVPASAAAR